MKILIITPFFYPAYAYGGPIEATLQLALELAKLGHSVRVLTTNANGVKNFSESDLTGKEIDGISVNYQNRDLASSISIGLLRILPREIKNADLVYLNFVYSFPTIPTLFLAKLFKKPLVWSPRGALQPWSGTKKNTLKRIWNKVCRIILSRHMVFQFTSRKEMDESIRNFGQSRYVISPNGIRIPNKVTRTPRGKILRCLYLGRIDRQKGIENLITAFIYLSKEEYSLNVFGGGDESYVAKLKKMAFDRKVSDKVLFKGTVDHEKIGEVFANHDVLILSSHMENFGNVISESLSFGVPVIVSKNTPWSSVERENCGLWIENDPISIAQAVKKINSMALSEMGSRGREWMIREFDWADQAKKIVDFAKKELLDDGIGKRNVRIE